MAITDVDVASHALVRIGVAPISSFEDGTTEANVAKNLYDAEVEQLLGIYRWRFATNTIQLSRLSTAPDHRWDAAYQLPDDALNLHGVFVNDFPIEFQRIDDEVHCNATVNDTVYLNYTRRVNEADWPPYFVMLAELRLASTFALAVAQNDTLAASFDQLFERQRARARSADSQQQTARRLPTSRLVTVRS